MLGTGTPRRTSPVVIGRAGEEVDEAGQKVTLGQVEERVEHVDARLVQLQKLVRVGRVDLRPVGAAEVAEVAEVAEEDREKWNQTSEKGDRWPVFDRVVL